MDSVTNEQLCIFCCNSVFTNLLCWVQTECVSGLVEIGSDGKMKKVDSDAALLFGKGSQDMIGQDFFDLVATGK